MDLLHFLSRSTPKLISAILLKLFTIILQQHLSEKVSLYEGIKQQLMCSSWKFCVVLFTTERSATLTKTPLKLKSRQRSSQERWDLLSNKHSMTNPFSQMTRPSHLLHKEWSQSIWLQRETTTPAWVMELHFWQKHMGSTKQTLQHLLKGFMGQRYVKLTTCTAQPIFLHVSEDFHFFQFVLLHMCTGCKDS